MRKFLVVALLFISLFGFNSSVQAGWEAGSWAGVRLIPLDLTIRRLSIGITSTDGLILTNPTAAAAGAQQISPRLRLTGQGWKTNATAASQTVDWIAELAPVQGAANPQARLDFNYQINGGGYQATPPLSLLNDKVGIGQISPTSVLHIKAGTATANTAPLKFTSGTLLTTAEAGAVEFLTDDFYATITTGAARKGLVLSDGTTLTSGRVPFATTSGRLVDDADLTFATDTLSATKLLAPTSVSTPSLISTGAIGITPAAGSNLNVALSTTGDFSVNTNQFYVDSSTGFIGVKTATPDSLFRVWSDSGARFGASFSFYSTILYDGMSNVGGVFNIDAATDFQIRTNVDSTSLVALRLTTTGNIGIGTVTFGTNAAKVLSLGSGTAPTTSPADVTQLWTADWNGAGTNALFIRTEETTQHVFGSSVGIGTVTFPIVATKVVVFDSTQLAARIGLTGQEFWEAANTSTDGLALVLGVNRASNRQLWIGDTAALAKNATNTVLRFVVGGTGMPTIDAISTDSTTTKLFALGNASGIQYGKALVALGGGATPTLGTIGGSGPTVAGQNAWVQLKDSTGADVWVPVWK